jgi:hypothetical protein
MKPLKHGRMKEREEKWIRGTEVRDVIFDGEKHEF